VEGKAGMGEFDNWHHITRCRTTAAVQWQLHQTRTCFVSQLFIVLPFLLVLLIIN